MSKTTKHADESTRNPAIVLGIVAVIGLVGAIFYLVYTHSHNNPELPQTVLQNARYKVYYPPKKTVVRVDGKSIRYNTAGQVTSYTAYTPSNNKLIITEQPAPDSVVHGKEGYQQLVDSLQRYDSLKSSHGTVYLTHPKELNGRQFAILRSQNTIIFIEPSQEISKSEWQKIFDSLQQQKSTSLVSTPSNSR